MIPDDHVKSNLTLLYVCISYCSSIIINKVRKSCSHIYVDCRINGFVSILIKNYKWNNYSKNNLKQYVQNVFKIVLLKNKKKIYLKNNINMKKYFRILHGTGVDTNILCVVTARRGACFSTWRCLAAHFLPPPELYSAILHIRPKGARSTEEGRS